MPETDLRHRFRCVRSRTLQNLRVPREVSRQAALESPHSKTLRIRVRQERTLECRWLVGWVLLSARATSPRRKTATPLNPGVWCVSMHLRAYRCAHGASRRTLQNCRPA